MNCCSEVTTTDAVAPADISRDSSVDFGSAIGTARLRRSASPAIAASRSARVSRPDSSAASDPTIGASAAVDDTGLPICRLGRLSTSTQPG